MNWAIKYLIALSIVWGCLTHNTFAVDFSPAPLFENNNSFGAFSIGGVYSRIQNSRNDLGNSKRGAVSFELKRGLMLLESRSLLLNAWLEGRAGNTNKNGLYGISTGGQLGYRFLNGRVIALVGGGFEMNTLPIYAESKEQYNLYGGIARAELFIDIARGYGLSVGYVHGFNERSKKLPTQIFSTDCIMISFSFYDFSI